ncbi:MAG: hypothetical protein RIR00_2293, partial [Pseudomonadota bacterium]
RLLKDVIAGQVPLTASPEATVRAACRDMAQKGVGAMMVVSQGALVGIFTERDVLNKVVAAGLDPETTTMAQVMASRVVSVEGDKNLAFALHLMRQGNFRHVPVVDAQNRPLGMVSARDALGAEMLDFEREEERMEELTELIG